MSTKYDYLKIEPQRELWPIDLYLMKYRKQSSCQNSSIYDGIIEVIDENDKNTILLSSMLKLKDAEKKKKIIKKIKNPDIINSTDIKRSNTAYANAGKQRIIKPNIGL